ncbi:MAG: glycoside hydrolase family 10 protein [Brevinema sp.]
MYRLLVILLLLVASNHAQEREFRGAWVATVFNIDWPSRSGLEKEQQQSELTTLFDTLHRLNFNAVILQVKPSADALYDSKLSPWSRYLTGTQGNNPGYDPLDFAIKEARKRRLEVHAWINPFRLTAGEKLENLATSHIARSNPEWIVEYGGRFYFNPGIPEVRNRIINEIVEIVKGYDIDALHMDDYFYPYRVGNIPFPDEEAYQKYGKGLSVEDWRRSNTEDFIKRVYEEIKKAKPYVRLAISPFGVWRNKSVDPKGSDTRAGQTNYDDLYADILSWVDKGYVDELLPQIYWDFENTAAPFGIVADWWSANVGGRTKLYAGLGIYRLGENWNLDGLRRQIDFIRKEPQMQGSAMFSAKWIQNNTKNIQMLLGEMFSTPAIPPQYDKITLQMPKVSHDKGELSWKAVPQAYKYAVYVLNPEGTYILEDVLDAKTLSYPAKEGTTYQISSLSRGYSESERASIVVLPAQQSSTNTTDIEESTTKTPQTNVEKNTTVPSKPTPSVAPDKPIVTAPATPKPQRPTVTRPTRPTPPTNTVSSD